MTNSVLNIDFIYITGYFLTINITNVNPYVIFFGGIIAIVVGLMNIVSKILEWKEKYSKKK